MITRDFQKSVALRASAGSGKTRALTDRLILMFLNGIKPSEILVVTFTNMAASDIKEKILRRIDALAKAEKEELKNFKGIMKVPERALINRARYARKALLLDFSSLQISTIHSFLLSLLQAFPERIEFPLSISVVDELAKEMMLLNAVENYYRYLENNDYELKKLRGFALEYAPRPINITRLLIDIYEKVSSCNPDKKEIDFYPVEELEKKYFKRVGFVESDRFYRMIEGIRSFILNKKPIKHERNLYGFTEKLLNLMENRRVDSKSFNFFNDKLVDPGNEDEKIVNYLKYFYSQLDEVEKKLFTRKLLSLRAFFANFLHIEMQYFTAMWLHVFSRIDGIYRKMKGEMRGVDFNDIERYAVRLLKEIPDYKSILFKLDKNIRYILIDEFQDTSIIQWEALKRIASECIKNKGSIFIVADVKQSIYRWRGGDPELFKIVKDEYGLEEDTLRYNYRQSGNLLRFVNDLFERIVENVKPDYPYIPQEFPEKLKKSSSNRGYVRIEPLHSEEEVYGKIVYWIKKLHSLGIRYNEIAVLCRKNTEIEALERIFLLNKVPFISQGKSSVLTDYCVRDVLNILKMLLFPDENNYAVSFLRSKIMRAGYPDIYKYIQNSTVSGIEILKTFSEEVYKKVKHLHLISCYTSLSRLLMDIYMELDLFNFYNDKREVLVDFLEIIDDFEKSNPGATLEDFILYIEEFGDRINFRNYDLDGVILQTIHSAKGLEYHTVILPFLRTKLDYEIRREIIRISSGDKNATPFLIPGKKYFDYLSSIPYIKSTLEKLKNDYKTDELNNLYVSLTRAIENLIIFPLLKSKNEKTFGKLVVDLMGGSENGVVEFGTLQGCEDKRDSAGKKEIYVKTLTFESSEIKKKSEPVFLYDEVVDEYFPGDFSYEERRMARLIGLVFHRTISMIRVPKSIKGKSFSNLIKSSLDAEAMRFTMEERERAIEKVNLLIAECLKDDRISRFLSEDSLSEVDMYLKINEREACGIRLDRILFGEPVEFIDFKTTVISGEEDIRKYIELYGNQLKKYYSALKTMYPDREVKGYIYFPDAPYELRLVEMT